VHLVELRALLKSLTWPLVYVGFLLYIFVMTTYQIHIGDAAVGLALLGLVLQREQLRFPPLLVGFVVLLAWCALGLASSAWPDVVTETLTEFAKLGLILLTAVNALRTRAQIRFFILFWVACFILYPARGAYVNYFIGGYTIFGRALWNHIYSNPNDLAALALLQLSMASGLLVTEPKGWTRKGAAVAVGMLTLLIFLTQSRGVLIGLSVFGVLTLVTGRRRLKSLAIALVLGLIVATVAPTGVWDRLGGLKNATDTENLSEVDQEGSAKERYQIWQTAFAIIEDHPVFGVGWGAYPQANARYAPVSGGGSQRLGAKDTHSTYFNIAAEIGYPGALLFLGLVFVTASYANRIRRRCKELMPQSSQQLFFLLLGLVGFMVAGIFGSYTRLSFLYLHLALMYALAQACEADLLRLRNAPDRRFA
jgi:O-antigen ligase